MEQRHIEILASELRDGDAVQVGFGGGHAYLLVADAVEQDGLIRVTIYDGLEREAEWSRSYAPEETVAIREDRNLKPVA